MLKYLLQNKKKVSWILGIFVVVLLIIIATSFYVSSRIKPFVQAQLGDVVRQATNRLYHIQFKDVNVNPLTGNASLTEVKLVPDTTVYRQLVDQKKAPNNIYIINLSELRIKNFHVFKIYFEKKLEIDLLLFEKPHITMINKALAFNENKPAQPEISPYDYVKDIFSALHVKAIEFKQATFKYVDNNGEKTSIDTISNISITLNDWLINSTSAKDKSRFYLLKDAHLYLNDYVYATPDSLYYIKASQFQFSAMAKQLKIKEFIVEPRYSEQEFAKANGYARDRYSLIFNNIDFNGIDMLAYIRTRELLAEEVSIANGVLSVFNDNSYPKLKKDKKGRFPYQLFQKIKIPITLKKVLINQLDINYAEFDAQSKQRGRIQFKNTSGVITNVTNEEKFKKINPIIEAEMQSYLMGQGKINANFKLNVVAPKADFSYKGSVVNMDARQLNYITKPLAMMQIKSCLVRRFDFDIKANEDVATGKVEFVYNDLSVGLMKQHKGGQRLERLGLLTLITNAMILSSDNPRDDGKFVVAPIYYERKPSGSFFSYLWQSLFQGVRYSIGFTPEKEAEIKRHIKQFETRKNDREKRKAKRDLRRLVERKNAK